MPNKYLSYDATHSVSAPVCMEHRMLMLVVLDALFAIYECQPATCSIKLRDTWREALLRCDFGRNMSVSQSVLRVQRFNDSAIIESLVTCHWVGQEVTYRCILHNDDLVLYTNGSQLSQFLFLGLPLPPPTSTPWAQIEEEEEGFHYLCHAEGNIEWPPFLCDFPRIHPPAVPTLQLRETTHNSIEVSWQGNGDGGPALGYDLNYTQANVEDWHSIRLDLGNTTYTASGLLCGTLYRFVVCAFNYKGFSPESPVLEVKTNGSAPFMATGSALVKEINSTTVTLDFIGWETAGCPIKFFSVKYCDPEDHVWNDVYNNISSDVGEVTVAELEPASRYMMVVTAHSQAGNVSSRFYFVTLPQPPPHEVNQEDGEREGKQMTGAEIALIVVVVSGLCLAVFLGLFLRWRFSRRAKHRKDFSVPLNDNSEAETQMGAADNFILLQPEQGALHSPEEQASLHVT